MYSNLYPHSGGKFPHHPHQNQQQKGVLVIGKPCTGKSDLAKLVQRELGGHHYSSSRALREYALRNDLRQILFEMEAGDIVTDVKAIELVSGWDFQDFLAHRVLGYFDGWGRLGPELEKAIRFMVQKCELHVAFLDGDRECLLQRGQGRGRGDDKSLVKRMGIYDDHSETLNDVAHRLLPSQRVHRIDTTHLDQTSVFDVFCKCIDMREIANVA